MRYESCVVVLMYDFATDGVCRLPPADADDEGARRPKPVLE